MGRKKTASATPKKRGLFDHVNSIFADQSIDYYDKLSEADKKTFSNYMVNRFISMNWNYVEVVNELQQYYGEVGPREVYLFYSQILPKGRQFNRYIKANKERQYEDWLVGLVGNHFSVSHREAEEYLDIYMATVDGRQQLRALMELYGIELRLIRKLGL